MSFVSLGSDGSARPTFFELVAAERLMPSLKSAAIYTLSVFAQRRHSLHRLANYEDELLAAITFALDKQSLVNSSASFSEGLYGLRRTNCQAEGVTAKAPVLNRSQQWLALMSLVGLPYLEAKLQKLHATVQSQQSSFLIHSPPNALEGQQGQSWLQQSTSMLRQGMLWSILRIYPYASSLAEGLKFVYQLMYLLDASPYYSPMHHLLGQRIVRVSGQDLIDAENLKVASRSLRMQQLSEQGWAVSLVKRFLLKTGHLFADHTRNALILSVFAFKLLEWWYTSAEQKLVSQRQLGVPPPPPLLAPHPDGLPLPENPSLCALCRQKRTNPAMATVSGFVFCYPCIFNHLSEHGRCPVTLLPSSIDQIRRLFQGQ